MPTIDELREIEEQKQKEKESEKERLKEKVICASVTFPSKMKKELGVSGFIMKLNELEDFIEQQMDGDEGRKLNFEIKFFMKTNKWVENLPEANI